MTEFLRTSPTVFAHTLKTVHQPCPRPEILKNFSRQGPAPGDGMSPAGPDYYDRFWHSEERASWYILIIKPTRCTNFWNLFLE